MKNQIEKVADFHEKFLQKRNDTPTLKYYEECELRHRLMTEENDEYLEACHKNDIVGIADALGDQMYILCGTILSHGMQDIIEKVFDEIHQSNMSKLDKEGKPLFREDGKIIKGENYVKPNLNQFF